MTKNKLDFTKPVQTRDGNHVKVFLDDRGSKYPVVGAYLFDNQWWAANWTQSGEWIDRRHHGIRTDANAHLDLIQAPPPKHKRWVNVYPKDSHVISTAHESREYADEYAHESRIACIEIEFAEGEGL